MCWLHGVIYYFLFLKKTLDFSFVNKIIWISLPRDYSITVDSKKTQIRLDIESI